MQIFQSMHPYLVLFSILSTPFSPKTKTPSFATPPPQSPPLAGPYSNLFASISANSHWIRGGRKHTFFFIKLYVFDRQNNAFEYESAQNSVIDP